jgi:hypothetical protein
MVADMGAGGRGPAAGPGAGSQYEGYGEHGKKVMGSRLWEHRYEMQI